MHLNVESLQTPLRFGLDCNELPVPAATSAVAEEISTEAGQRMSAVDKGSKLVTTTVRNVKTEVCMAHEVSHILPIESPAIFVAILRDKIAVYPAGTVSADCLFVARNAFVSLKFSKLRIPQSVALQVRARFRQAG